MAKRRVAPTVMTGVCESEKVFLDAQITRIEKEHIWVIVNGNGYVIKIGDISENEQLSIGKIIHVNADLIPGASK